MGLREISGPLSGVQSLGFTASISGSFDWPKASSFRLSLRQDVEPPEP